MNSIARSTARGRSYSVGLICTIVIVLCSATVISTVHCNSITPTAAATAGDQQQPPVAEPAKQPAAQAPALALEKADAVEKRDQQVEAKSAAPASEQPKQADSAKPDGAEQTRKGRSEAPPAASEPGAKSSTSDTAAKSPSTTSKPAEQQKSTTSKSSVPHSSKQPTGKSGQSSSSSSSSSAPGKRLPANLGTVTSTGSGGPAHYMSKHDAYSAIAEKHGALAQSAMRKSDKRNSDHHHGNLQRFGGIQKASGFSEALNPFKSVTDGGLARTLGASMRSIMKGKYSIPAYVASAVLGAVALMAFYESPISPLPVPALPEPPVGRFPPEMPVISPNLPVPFRMNQQGQQQPQQQYGQQNGYTNQRSFQVGQQQQQQPQQVLFPGVTVQQQAQQRQGPAGPVQQLAANLISSVGANRQTAQRKSGADPDAASSRSFFGGGSSTPAAANKLGAPANQNQPKPAGGSILSYLGFGSSGSGGATAGQQSAAQPLNGGLGDVHRASGLGAMSAGHDATGSLSNSHLVNKVKSYFDRPVPHQSWSMDNNVPNQYDQYRRMSIMQALAKDTAFLSSFFTPARRSSNATAGATSPLQQSINAALSSASSLVQPAGTPAPTPQVASSRMQSDSFPGLPSLTPFNSQAAAPATAQQQQPAKRASSGYGLMRTADRVANALLDTLTAGLLHRGSEKRSSSSSSSSNQHQQQQHQQQLQQNALASATSILSDIMSSYNAAQQAANEAAVSSQQQHQQQPQQSVSQPESSGKTDSQSQDQSSGRSADSAISSAERTTSVAEPASKASPGAVASASESEQTSVGASQQPLVRKTRSIGHDYPMDSFQQQHQQQNQQQPPSRATQINNLVDYVSDSYKQNKLLFSFVMNQVGLSQALPYVDQFLNNPNEAQAKERNYD